MPGKVWKKGNLKMSQNFLSILKMAISLIVHLLYFKTFIVLEMSYKVGADNKWLFVQCFSEKNKGLEI